MRIRDILMGPPSRYARRNADGYLEATFWDWFLGPHPDRISQWLTATQRSVGVGGEIAYTASDKLLARIGQDGVDGLVKFFFEQTDPDDVEWIDLSTIEWQKLTNPHGILPMYTITNGDTFVLIWPTLDRGRRILALETREERPELKNEITWWADGDEPNNDSPGQKADPEDP
jgi:hypothetical protein